LGGALDIRQRSKEKQKSQNLNTWETEAIEIALWRSDPYFGDWKRERKSEAATPEKKTSRETHRIC